jgi:hypothetical protein
VGCLAYGPASKIKSLLYLPPNSVLCGHDNGMVSAYDVRAGRLRYVFTPHRDAVTWMRLVDANYHLQNGRQCALIITASMDHRVKFHLLPDEALFIAAANTPLTQSSGSITAAAPAASASATRLADAPPA